MKPTTLATIFVSALLLAACGSGESAPDAASLSTSDAAATTSTTAELKEVDPEKFASGYGIYSMRYVINDKISGDCSFYKGGVTCTGKPADDVPDLGSDYPVPGTRPNAVDVSAKGVKYWALKNSSDSPAALISG